MSDSFQSLSRPRTVQRGSSPSGVAPSRPPLRSAGQVLPPPSGQLIRFCPPTSSSSAPVSQLMLVPVGPPGPSLRALFPLRALRWRRRILRRGRLGPSRTICAQNQDGRKTGSFTDELTNHPEPAVRFWVGSEPRVGQTWCQHRRGLISKQLRHL